MTSAYTIRPLDSGEASIEQAIALLRDNCPAESLRYQRDRLLLELGAADSEPFYRKFFAAYDNKDGLIAVGGIKSADWASDTHILYMMAVAKHHRGKGVGTDLEKARLKWLKEHFAHGRCLVSTRHKKRFERWGFKCLSELEGKHLMMLVF